jgi:leader peptidase (prepilin peptidase) / N-methyltransferase
MNIAVAFMFALFGLVIGSFLNVVIDRLPAGESIAFPPSHCSSCKHHLALKDLVPVVSYAFLKGRCRYCGEHITLRIPIVEASTALAFGLLFLKFPHSPASLAIVIFYFCLLLVIGVIDLEHQLILNRLVYPAAPIAAALSLLAFRLDMVPDIERAAIGLAIGLVLFLLIALLSRGGMGLGDVKMAALVGIILGYPNVLVAIFLAIIAGGIIALILLATRKKGRRQGIPFGPFLALGTMLALIWGNSIWRWYTRGF